MKRDVAVVSHFPSFILCHLQRCSAAVQLLIIGKYLDIFNKPQTYSTTPDAMGCGIVIVILTWSNYSNVGLTWSEMETKTGSVEHWVRRKTWGNVKFISASSTKTLIDLPELFHLIISQTQETADTYFGIYNLKIWFYCLWWDWIELFWHSSSKGYRTAQYLVWSKFVPDKIKQTDNQKQTPPPVKLCSSILNENSWYFNNINIIRTTNSYIFLFFIFAPKILYFLHIYDFLRCCCPGF